MTEEREIKMEERERTIDGGRVGGWVGREKSKNKKKSDGNKLKERIKGRKLTVLCQRAVGRLEQQTHDSAAAFTARFPPRSSFS